MQFQTPYLQVQCPDLAFYMSPEVAGHVGVHVAKAVEGAKGQVKEEAPHEGEVPPYLKIGCSRCRVLNIGKMYHSQLREKGI